MKYAIIVSEQDPAGLNIKEKLLRLWKFKETDVFDTHPVYTLDNVSLYTVETFIILAEGLKIDADRFIFASKHAAKSGNSTFCVHPIGNWSKAEHGGRDRTMVNCMPSLMKKALLEFEELNTIGWEVTMEATHHGPYTEKPSVFIEIGSTEVQWGNKEAALIAAKVIMSLVDDIKEVDSCVVLGGTHYNHVANKIMMGKDLAVGHVCPKFALEYLSEDLLFQAMEASGASLIVLDWDGLGSNKDKIRELTKNLDVKRSKEL